MLLAKAYATMLIVGVALVIGIVLYLASKVQEGDDWTELP